MRSFVELTRAPWGLNLDLEKGPFSPVALRIATNRFGHHTPDDRPKCNLVRMILERTGHYRNCSPVSSSEHTIAIGTGKKAKAWKTRAFPSFQTRHDRR